MEEVRAEQAGRGVGSDADLDLDARVAEAAHTGAGDVRVGILDRDDDAADAGGDERIRTRASTAVVGAGFERDDGGRPGGR